MKNLIYANYSDLNDNISQRKSHFIPDATKLEATIQSTIVTKNEKVDKRNKITHWNFLAKFVRT